MGVDHGNNSRANKLLQNDSAEPLFCAKKSRGKTKEKVSKDSNQSCTYVKLYPESGLDPSPSMSCMGVAQEEEQPAGLIG